MNTFIEFTQSWTGGGRYSIFLFPFIGLLLLFCSLKIVNYSLIIINKTKFGAGFFGTTVIALITSLPELITEITQAKAGHPENGLGDDIGSNLFSTFLIAVGAFIFAKKWFLNNLSKWTKITIIMSFIMSIIVTIGLVFVGKDLNLKIIGIIPLTLFLCYLFTIYLSNKYGDKDLKKTDSVKSNATVNKAIFYFIFFGLGVIIFAILININLIAFQRDFDIKSDSIGGILLASVTSLPEVVAFFSLLRKNESTVAVTSLTGSHFFNLGLIFIGDLIYSDGASFNKAEMQEQLPVAILNSILIFLLILHFILEPKIKAYKKNKCIYLTIPFIMIVGYLIGWTLILSLN